MKDGFVTSCGLIILFSFRFIDEFFKTNQEPFEDGLILNMGQLLSIPFILAGVVLLVLTIGSKRDSISTNRLAIDREEKGMQ